MPAGDNAAQDALFTVCTEEGTFRLSVHGQPVRHFYPGWRAFALHMSLLPLPVLRLRHDSGGEAFWLLDRHFNYRASTLDGLSGTEREGMMEAVAPFFSALRAQALAAVTPVPVVNGAGLQNLGPALLEELLTAWWMGATPPLCVPVAQALTGTEEGMFSFGIEALSRLLPLAGELARLATPVILSPSGRSVLRGLPVLRERDLSLIRFADPAQETVFYLGCGERGDGPSLPLLYCPQVNLVVTDLPAAWAGEVPRRLLGRFACQPDLLAEVGEGSVLQFGATDRLMLGAASSLAKDPPPLPGEGRWAEEPEEYRDIQLDNAFRPSFASLPDEGEVDEGGA